ncbi:MAG: hypothetical protein WC683_09805 [bacterium]
MGVYASPSGLLIAERDPTLALYPIAINDFAAGQFLNAQTNVNATMAGGSTLLGQAKYRNDFQRLTSTCPTLGYRAAPAWTNLDYALDPDNPSAEGGTVGTHTATGVHHMDVMATDSWHGSRCFRLIVNAPAPTFDTDLMAVTAASTQYTTAAMVKATAGRTIRASLIGDTSGATPTDFPATGNWQLVYVTKTFAAGDTTSRDRSILLTDGQVGDTFLVDAVITVAGSTVPMFEESECVATSCTFPTPFTAGEPVSFLFFVWTPWAGNDGVTRFLFSMGNPAAANSMFIRKTNTNVLNFNIYDAAGAVRGCTEAVDATDWPAGTMKVIAASRDAAGNMLAYLGGTAFTTQNAGAGSGLMGAAAATIYFGNRGAGLDPLNGLILPFTYRGVAWGDEECEYYSTLQAPPPRARRVA